MPLLRKVALKAYHTIPIGLRSHFKWALTIPDMEASLRNMRRLGFAPATVIDVGAYVGNWTRMCKRLFPDAQVLMCEPQPDKAAVLARVTSDLSNVRHEPVLLGAEPGGPVTFHVFESGSSMYSFGKAEQSQQIQLPVTTLDAVTRGTPFAEPGIIKIDVQGAELDVLRGGREAMSRAEVVVLEVSVVNEYDGSPLFHEVQQFMAENDFRLYDICTIWRNTPTDAMDQADVIFVRADSQLFDRRHYTKK